MKQEKKIAQESAQRQVWKLVKSYFKGVRNDSYIEEINGKPYLFVIYYDFRPIKEVDAFVQTCLKTFHGIVKYGEVRREYTDKALRFQYKMNLELSKFSFVS